MGLEKMGSVLLLGKLKTAVAIWLLLVVQPMGSHSSKLIQSVCQFFRIVPLLVYVRVDHYHMPNSMVLT